MNPKRSEWLHLLITNRAMIGDPPKIQALALERLHARRLATFIPLRLSELSLSPNDLADILGIEHQFIDTMIDGSFPLAALSRDLWRELATALQCTLATLRRVISGEDYPLCSW